MSDADDLADLQTEYAAIKAQLVASAAKSMSADNVMVVNHDYVALSKRAAQLRQLIRRLSGDSPMVVRGVVKGLR